VETRFRGMRGVSRTSTDPDGIVHVSSDGARL